MSNGAAGGGQPIIVIKRIKKGGHGHHGGAWKVAYADFVTAMMAFFMLLWLMGSTTEQQQRAIADFFQYPSTIDASGGASESFLQIGDTVPDSEDGQVDNSQSSKAENVEIERQSLEELQAEEELLGMEYLMETMKEAIESNEILKDFKDQLIVDMTSEGLRIQIVDKENRPMFERGGARMQPYTRELLAEIVKVIRDVPNRISIAGHTDAHEYANIRGYTNWELSADRANTARRELLAAGMPPDKLARVVGLASSVLFDTSDPYNPINRRISITVMNRAAEEAVVESQGPGNGAEPAAASTAGPATAPVDAPAPGILPARAPAVPAVPAAPAARPASPAVAAAR
jgi:chemotaxis protein MotB